MSTDENPLENPLGLDEVVDLLRHFVGKHGGTVTDQDKEDIRARLNNEYVPGNLIITEGDISEFLTKLQTDDNLSETNVSGVLMELELNEIIKGVYEQLGPLKSEFSLDEAVIEAIKKQGEVKGYVANTSKANPLYRSFNGEYFSLNPNCVDDTTTIQDVRILAENTGFDDVQYSDQTLELAIKIAKICKPLEEKEPSPVNILANNTYGLDFSRRSQKETVPLEFTVYYHLDGKGNNKHLISLYTDMDSPKVTTQEMINALTARINGKSYDADKPQHLFVQYHGDKGLIEKEIRNA